MAKPFHRIYLIEPYFSGSHKQWATSWQKKSTHSIRIFSLPGKHWKWRMQGAALPLARQIKTQEPPDLFCVTDMVNLPELKGLLPSTHTCQPFILYMHENQLSYPPSPYDKDALHQRDHTYGLINIKSCVAADQVVFNSHYHKDIFFAKAKSFVTKFPDHSFHQSLPSVIEKSHVLPIGLDLQTDTSHTFRQTSDYPNSHPTILWNHRWEYDKRPDLFWAGLRQLKSKWNLNFQLIICGKPSKQMEDLFAKAKEEFSDHIIHWGYTSDRNSYTSLLKQADIVWVTSEHDFFGISVVEAIAAGCIPLLPNRCAYPEHLPPELHNTFLYETMEEGIERLSKWLNSPPTLPKELFTNIQRYDWSCLLSKYDGFFAAQSKNKESKS